MISVSMRGCFFLFLSPPNSEVIWVIGNNSMLFTAWDLSPHLILVHNDWHSPLLHHLYLLPHLHHIHHLHYIFLIIFIISSSSSSSYLPHHLHYIFIIFLLLFLLLLWLLLTPCRLFCRCFKYPTWPRCRNAWPRHTSCNTNSHDGTREPSHYGTSGR